MIWLPRQTQNTLRQSLRVLTRLLESGTPVEGDNLYVREEVRGCPAGDLTHLGGIFTSRGALTFQREQESISRGLHGGGSTFRHMPTAVQVLQPLFFLPRKVLGF